MRFILIIGFLFFGNSYARENIFQEMVDCYDSFGCVEKEILSEVNQKNILDIYQILKDKNVLTGESRLLNILLVDYEKLLSQNSIIESEDNFLNYQIEILKELLKCIDSRASSGTSPFSEKLELILPTGLYDFAYGSVSENKFIIQKIKRSYYECLLPFKGKYSEKDKELCVDKAYKEYFADDLDKSLEKFAKLYGEKDAVEKLKKDFDTCFETETVPWSCYRTLNFSLNKMKGLFLYSQLEILNKVYDPVIKQSYETFITCMDNVPMNLSDIERLNKKLNDKGYLTDDEYAEVANKKWYNSHAYSNCLTSFFGSMIVEEGMPAYKKEFLEKTIKVKCPTKASIESAIECIENVKFVKEYSGNEKLLGEIFYRRELRRAQENYEKISSSHDSYEIFSYQGEENELLSVGSKFFFTKRVDIPMTERACIKYYTGSGSSLMNQHLWASFGVVQEDSRNDFAIPCAISGINKIQKNSTLENGYYAENVSRGMGDAPFTDRFSSKGDCIVFTGFTSTSYGIDVFPRKYRLRIKNCPKGSSSTGVMVSYWSNYEDESEVLFPPGVRFKVVKPKEDKNVKGEYEVGLECITEEQAEKEKLTCY